MRWSPARARSPGSDCCRCESGSRRSRPWTGHPDALTAPASPATRSTTASSRGRAGPAEAFLDGWRQGPVWGTSWHGIFENDEFRRGFLAEVAAIAGRDFRPAPGTDFAALRAAQLDLLGDLVVDHLDTGAVLTLLAAGAPPGLPVLPPAGPAGPG